MARLLNRKDFGIDIDMPLETGGVTFDEVPFVEVLKKSVRIRVDPDS